ncbi:MAG: hypothetical protein ACPGWR_17435 [Ardenticatenaceae bacterium]
MPESMTYSDMERFLTQELHFQTQNIPGSHTIFKQPNTDLIIVLNPWYKVLPKRQLAYVRQMLAANGIMSKSQFNQLATSL